MFKSCPFFFSDTKNIRDAHEKEFKYLTGQKDVDKTDPKLAGHFVADTQELSLISNETTSYGTCDEKTSVDSKDGPTKSNNDTGTINKDSDDISRHQMSDSGSVTDTSNKIGFRDFFPTLLQLLRSPTFIFLCLAYTCSFMVITSFAVFMAKTVQFQYNQTPAMSAILAGK